VTEPPYFGTFSVPLATFLAAHDISPASVVAISPNKAEFRFDRTARLTELYAIWEHHRRVLTARLTVAMADGRPM
jgi:hypothetical protein